MILLSLVLVVASAAALVWGIVTASQSLVWASLAAGLAAVALVTGAVVRRRGRLALDAGRPPVGDGSRPEPASGPTPDRPTSPPAVGGSWQRPEPDVEAGGGWRPGAGPTPGAAGEGMPAEAVERPLGEPFPPPTEAPPANQAPADEPPVEDVPVREALRVAQLADEVRVVDGHPRYHLAGCPTVAGAETVALPVSTARRSGFTPCGTCRPDRTLLDRSRARGRPTPG